MPPLFLIVRFPLIYLEDHDGPEMPVSRLGEYEEYGHPFYETDDHHVAETLTQLLAHGPDAGLGPSEESLGHGPEESHGCPFNHAPLFEVVDDLPHAKRLLYRRRIETLGSKAGGRGKKRTDRISLLPLLREFHEHAKEWEPRIREELAANPAMKSAQLEKVEWSVQAGCVEANSNIIAMPKAEVVGKVSQDESLRQLRNVFETACKQLDAIPDSELSPSGQPFIKECADAMLAFAAWFGQQTPDDVAITGNAYRVVYAFGGLSGVIDWIGLHWSVPFAKEIETDVATLMEEADKFDDQVMKAHTLRKTPKKLELSRQAMSDRAYGDLEEAISRVAGLADMLGYRLKRLALLAMNEVTEKQEMLGKDWHFENLPKGEVLAKNQALCREYAQMDMGDLLVLSHQWRAMVSRFVLAADQAGHHHGHRGAIVHDEQVHRATKILETALAARKIKNVDTLGRCLRHPSETHLHYALAALDELDACLRAEGTPATTGGQPQERDGQNWEMDETMYFFQTQSKVQSLVDDADLPGLMRLVRDDLVHWNDLLKHHLLAWFDDQKEGGAIGTIFSDGSLVGPLGLMRPIVGVAEAYRFLELTLGPDRARALRTGFDEFFAIRDKFVRFVVGYAGPREGNEYNAYQVAVDDQRKQMRESVGSLVQHVDIVRSWIERNPQSPKTEDAHAIKQHDDPAGPIPESATTVQRSRTQATQGPDVPNTSRPMPLTEIANRVLKDPKKWRKLKSLYGDRLQQLGGKGSKNWTIRLDGLAPNIRKELERA